MLAAIALVAGAIAGPSLVSQDDSPQSLSAAWSYSPLERPPVPDARSWATNEIDAFILRRLEGAGLRPAPPADRRALIRRATYDLTGLPPTFEQVEAFVANESPDAYGRLIDRLLASPQYGVRWGRHWLDLVRWAETDSYERGRVKPGAWRYRDWVIDALNANMPYDEFVTMQHHLISRHPPKHRVHDRPLRRRRRPSALRLRLG